MDNLFGEVNLKMAYYFSASFAPTFHGRKSRVFKQLAAFVECVVERPVLPFVKDRFGHHQFFSSNHVKPAIDTEYLAGDVTGRFRSKKQDQRGNLFRLSQPFHGNKINDRAENLSGEFVLTHLFN
jgi:hypothetical protein